MSEPLGLPGFRSFWLANTVGFLGLAITTVAVDVLVIEVLDASEVQVGLVRGAQFLPYLLIGLLAGAYVDRWRRKPTLIVANLAHALLLLAIPALVLADLLTITTTGIILFAVGCCAVVTVAAEQSYLPDLVPRRSLVLANARLGQSMAVAQSSGPALGGLLVAVVSAPAALLVSSLTRLITAGTIARIHDPEPAPHPAHPRLWRGILEGLAFMYSHRTLAPLAISTHLWFLANSIALTVLGLFVLRGLGLSALVYGLVLAAAGVGGLLGAFGATRAAAHLGEGTVIIAARTVCAVTWLATALTPTEAAPWITAAYLCGVQLVYGFSMGIEDPSEMGYQQSVTPRAMLGRVNATKRSANRSAAVLGAVLGGVLAASLGFRPTFAVVTGIFAAAVVVAAASPLRGARSD
ncbi:MFS transporter [Brachybacterium sp. FME24]|uniref:MFS transporter n=1 Tax=Brachybacterium sp. FME24 TaxID=2742605 RepID=UPI0018662320|nr:MFS transporter [Brachybacterium sp. FME24]